MKTNLLTGSLITLFYSLSLFAQSSSKGTLEIKFTDLRSDLGVVAIGINTSPEGWPREPQIELQLEKSACGRRSIYRESA